MVILHTGSPGVDRATMRRSVFKAMCTSRIPPTRTALAAAVTHAHIEEDVPLKRSYAMLRPTTSAFDLLLGL
jgi:hypothetical protein